MAQKVADEAADVDMLALVDQDQRVQSLHASNILGDSFRLHGHHHEFPVESRRHSVPSGEWWTHLWKHTTLVRGMRVLNRAPIGEAILECEDPVRGTPW